MENEEMKTKAPAEASAPASAENNNAKPSERPNRPQRTGGRSEGFQGRRPRGHRFPIKKDYEERVVHIARVSKTVKGGRRIRFSALVVIGNGKGKYGYGIGKSLEVPDAIKKAIQTAHSDLKNLPIVKNDTIPHTVEGLFGACKVFLKPAPAGTGLVAGGPVRAILELAGIKNVYSKVYGSRSSINVIKATVNGLNQLKTVSPSMTIAQEDIVKAAPEAAANKEAAHDEVK